MDELADKKRLLMLDMWADVASGAGPSKRWLHAELDKAYQTTVVNPGTSRADAIIPLLRSFTPDRKRWGSRYYRFLEQREKTPTSFRKRTRSFTKALEGISFEPQAVLQIGGLFGPVRVAGVPYLSYHDQTVKMVERGWPQWLPDDFAAFSDEWYALEGSLYQSATRILTYSRCTRESMIRDYGVAPEKVAVIPSACKMAPASRSDLEARTGKRLLFVPTDFHRKGGDLVLAALPLIRQAHPEATLTIAGAKLPAGVTVDDRAVTHLGCLPPDQLRRCLLDSRLLLHPARYDAFPNVAKEALACGVPVVASRSCGIPEIVTDGETGVTLKEPTAAALAAAVIALLDDGERLAAMSDNCLADSARFGVETVGRQFRQTIEACREREVLRRCC